LFVNNDRPINCQSTGCSNNTTHSLNCLINYFINTRHCLEEHVVHITGLDMIGKRLVTLIWSNQA